MTKRIFVILLCGFILCGVSALAYDKATSMVPINKTITNLINQIENDWDEEIVHIQYDILKTEKSYTRNLSKGFTYSVSAVADYRFSDIDIAVYKKSGNGWQCVAKDDDNGANPRVQFKVNSDCSYKITITAVEFKGKYNVGHYGLIIAHNKK